MVQVAAPTGYNPCTTRPELIGASWDPALEETELERSYALDDAFEEATGARNGSFALKCPAKGAPLTGFSRAGGLPPRRTGRAGARRAECLARVRTRLRRSLGLWSDGSLTTALMRKARSAAKRRRGAQKASTGPFTRGARVCAVCEPEKHRRFIPFSLGRIHSDG